MAAEELQKNAVDAAVGFVSLFSYMNTKLSLYPIAKAIKAFHWHGFFTIILITSVFASLCLTPF